MSVDCSIYAGHRVSISEITGDYDFIDELYEKYPELDSNEETGVKIITDGMNGIYTYLMYVEGKIRVFNGEDDKEIHFELSKEKAFEKLKEYYFLITGKQLDISQVETVIFQHYY